MSHVNLDTVTDNEKYTNLTWTMLGLLILAIFAFLPTIVFLESMKSSKPIEPPTMDNPPSYDELFPERQLTAL